jgi:hypothetical protein
MKLHLWKLEARCPPSETFPTAGRQIDRSSPGRIDSFSPYDRPVMIVSIHSAGE